MAVKWLRMALLTGLLPWFAPVGRAGDSPTPTVGPPGAQEHLRTALDAAQAKIYDKAEAEIIAAISDPGFGKLGVVAQRVAFTTAASLALRSKKPEPAQQFAIRATELAGAGIDDWQLRLTASLKLHDARDEGIALTAVAHEWGRDRNNLPQAMVQRVVYDLRNSSFDALRLNLLDALYAADWDASPDTTASTLWRDLSCLLLARGETDRAIEVASHIDGPYDVVALRADARFRPLFRFGGVAGDARATMRRRVERLRMLVAVRPRSLQVRNALLRALLATGELSEVLAMSDPVSGPDAASKVDDLETEQSWTLDARARALVGLGRSDEAVAELRRATVLPERRDKFSQPINLAALLCELGRPEEALAALPLLPVAQDSDTISPYGMMQVESVRLTAALELQHAADADEALAYLRAHREDSMSTLQRALVRAGQQAEAAAVLIARLHDSSERTGALLELQSYARAAQPPAAAEWHRAELDLAARPEVRRAVHQVGSIASYPWLAAPES